MGTEVLHPQNCLGGRPRAIIQRRRNNGNLRPAVRPNQQSVVPEKLRMLRRGESFDSISQRFSAEVFAGSSTLVLSPAPSSLPLPSFSRKVQNQVVFLQADDSASRDLRRLLRLQF